MGLLRGARKRQALPLRLQQAYPEEFSSTSITALPTDLMVQIFGHLDAKALRCVLPMVCRQWWASHCNCVCSAPADSACWLEAHKCCSQGRLGLHVLRMQAGSHHA